MNWFQLDIKKLLIIAAVLILPLFTINLQKPGESLWVFRPFSAAFGGIQNIFISFSTSVRETAGIYLNLVNIKKNNRILTAKMQELESKLLLFQELQQENKRLNSLMDFKQKTQYELVSAKIIGLDLLGERFTVRINRGEKNQLAKGMAVITPEGVVGYILKVHKKSSIILLITDRYAVVDSIVQNSRARGIAEGNGPNSVRLKYLQRADEVNEGDLIVTSGLDNIFPKGFPVGHVKSVSKNKSDITQYVEVTPTINPSRLEEVFVVKKIPIEKIPGDIKPQPTEGENSNEKQAAKSNE